MASLMELTLNQTYYNQKCVNRWNYVASGTPSAVTLSFALMSAMGFLPTSTTLLNTTIGGKIQLLQNVGVIFNSAIARAVYIDDDFYDSPFLANTQGLTSASGDGMTPLNAFGFFSTRVKQSINRGYKRFVGVSEGLVNAGGVFASSINPTLDDLGDSMGETLTYDDEGTTISFVPAIVQKEKYTVESSGKTAYRYYASEATQLIHTAQGISFNPYGEVRSQVSRQYGRGA